MLTATSAASASTQIGRFAAGAKTGKRPNRGRIVPICPGSRPLQDLARRLDGRQQIANLGSSMRSGNLKGNTSGLTLTTTDIQWLSARALRVPENARPVRRYDCCSRRPRREAIRSSGIFRKINGRASRLHRLDRTRVDHPMSLPAAAFPPASPPTAASYCRHGRFDEPKISAASWFTRPIRSAGRRSRTRPRADSDRLRGH